jgi:hypothetical protein
LNSILFKIFDLHMAVCCLTFRFGLQSKCSKKTGQGGDLPGRRKEFEVQRVIRY